MTPFRIGPALLSFLLFPLLHAQELPETVAKEIQVLATLLRSQPPEVAMHRIDSLLALPATTQDPRLPIALYNFRGHALRLLGRQDEALAAQVRSYELADQLNDHRGQAEAQIAIAIIHMDRDELDKARRELLTVYKLSETRPVERGYRVPLILGAIANKAGQLDSALYWYGKALPQVEAAHDSMTICDIRFNIGLAHGKKMDQRASESYLLGAIAAIPSNGYPQMEARAYEALSALYMKEKRWNEVPKLLDKAHQLSIIHGAGDLLENILSNRIRYFQGIGDTAAALEVSQQLVAVKDSLATIVRERTLAEVQASFDVTRMEKELALTRSEAEVNKLRAQRSWIAWGALAVIGALAVVLVILFRRQYLMKEQAAAALESDKERLLEENELLHQENLMARFETLKSQIDPHFLFNAMNTLYTLVETEPKKAREFVSSFSALYRKVLTSRERTIVPVQEELELVHHYLFLQRIRFGESLQVKVEVPAHALNGYLPPFTLQMLLENAIKHNVISAAHPLHITITVEGDHLIVRNDLMPRGTKEAGTGTGLENIRRRYIMLGAQEPTFTVADPYYTASVPILSQEQ
jgi:tetratricopeptide (TPR) repeat protein